MDKIAKNAIHDLVLSLRKTLEAEIERELGRYGVYANRMWIHPDELPRLSEKERTYDRSRIEAAIQREEDADLEACDLSLETIIQANVNVDLPEWSNGSYRKGKPSYAPDLDDGVKVNTLPLQAADLLPMKKVV